MKHYFQHSEEWYNFTVGDNILYRAVNPSLDKTTDRLGRQTFTKNLQTHRWALKKGDQVCREDVTFPCSLGGSMSIQNDCMIWDDSACGMDCPDRFAEDFNLKKRSSLLP
jgi:hypothetical protein